MRWREFTALLGGATIARPLDVRAQQPAIPGGTAQGSLAGASRIALLSKPDAMPDGVREVRLREADASAQALGMELKFLGCAAGRTSTGSSRICPKRARVLSSCGQHPYSNLSDDASRISRQSIGYRLSSSSGYTLRQGAYVLRPESS
jgi:hypothetical protein